MNDFKVADLSLAGRTAVVTGASRGIGKALAQIFALHGYNLFLNSRTESHLLQTIEELKTAYPNIAIDGKALNVGKKTEATIIDGFQQHGIAE